MFHAIVVLGLSAASAGCGGQTEQHPPADAAGDTPLYEPPEASSMEAGFELQDAAAGVDATLSADADAGADASDTGGDGWTYYPSPPVIA